MKRIISFVLTLLFCIYLFPAFVFAGETLPTLFSEDFNKMSQDAKIDPKAYTGVLIKGFSAVKKDGDSDNTTPYITGTSNSTGSQGKPTSTIEFIPITGKMELSFKMKGYTATNYSQTIVIYSSDDIIVNLLNVNSSLRLNGKSYISIPDGEWADVKITLDPTLDEDNFSVSVDDTEKGRETIPDLKNKTISKIGFGFLANIDDVKIVGDNSKIIEEYNSYVASLQSKISEIKSKIDALSLSNNDEKIVKASYEWTLFEVENTIVVSTPGADKKSVMAVAPYLDYLLKALSDKSVNTQGGQLPTNILPQFSESNPFANGAFNDAGKYLDLNLKDLKPFGTAQSLTDDGLLATYAFMHPQSPFYENPKMLQTALTYLYMFIPQNLSSDTACTRAYYLIKTKYPNLIIPEIKRKFETIMEEGVKKQIGYTRDNNYVMGSWLNGEIWDVVNVGFKGLVLDKPEYVKWTNDNLQYIQLTMLPDGGTNYAGYANETITYHSIAIINCLEFWKYTKSEIALKFALDSLKYSPLSGSIRKVSEHYSAASWKHYWNQVGTGGIPELSAVTGDPLNYALISQNPSFSAATFYEIGLQNNINKVFKTNDSFEGTGIPKPVLLPDNYVIYDRNIIGTRANYGDFNYALFSRDNTYYPGKGIGGTSTMKMGYANDSFVGFAILYSIEEMFDEKLIKADGYRPAWPLDVAAEEFNIVLTTDDKHSSDFYNKVKGIVDSEPSISLTNTLSALSSKYYGASERFVKFNDAVNTQEWVMSKDRAMGLLSTEITNDVMLKSIAGVSKYISGRNFWGVRKEFKEIDKNTFEYGGAKIKIHQTNFKGIELTYTDTFDGNVKKVGVLNLKPEESTKLDGDATLYPKGTKYYYLIEVVPHWADFATEAKVINNNGLTGFEYKDNEKTVAILHNATEANITANYSLPQGYSKYSVQLSTDGSVDRDKYLNLINYNKMQNVDSGNKFSKLDSPTVEYTVPQNRHIMMIASNNEADHDGNYKFYEDVFKINPTVAKLTSFSDIADHWSKKNIIDLVGRNVINGYPDGTFKPDDNILVDEFIKTIMTAIGFKDIQNGSDYWAQNYIDKAIGLGIVKTGEFDKYDRPINRFEVARMIARSMRENYKVPEAVKNNISDFNEIPDEYKNFVLIMSHKKIISGYEDKSFKGTNNSTRAEAATMLKRYLNLY